MYFIIYVRMCVDVCVFTQNQKPTKNLTFRLKVFIKIQFHNRYSSGPLSWPLFFNVVNKLVVYNDSRFILSHSKTYSLCVPIRSVRDESTSRNRRSLFISFIRSILIFYHFSLSTISSMKFYHYVRNFFYFVLLFSHWTVFTLPDEIYLNSLFWKVFES